MAEVIEAIGHALEAYWASPVPLIVVFASLACIGTLVYVFLTNARNARLRVSLLTGLYSVSIFFWSFLATSLVLCLSLAPMVAYRSWGVPAAAGGALFSSLGLSAAISLIAWSQSANRVLRRIPTHELRGDEQWITDFVNLIGRFERLAHVEVRVTEDVKPIAMAVSGPHHFIIVSTGLFAALEREEIETVLAHELMHIRNHDSRFKVVSAVLTRLLFFDPFSKFLDPAVHREREYLADEMGGRVTGKPAALASALLKIHERGGDAPRALAGLSIVGREGRVFSKFPPIKERISRLILLSEILSQV